MKRRTVNVHTVGGAAVGDATETGVGAAGFLLLLWIFTEYAHRKLI